MAVHRPAERVAGDNVPVLSAQIAGAEVVGVGVIGVRYRDDDSGAEGTMRLAVNSLDELRALELAVAEVRGQLTVFERAGRRVRAADDTVELCPRRFWPGL